MVVGEARAYGERTDLAAGTLAACTPAPVVAALLAIAVGSAFTQPAGAHILRARAGAARTAATVGPALLALAVGAHVTATARVAQHLGAAGRAVEQWSPRRLRERRLAFLAHVERILRPRGHADALQQAEEVLDGEFAHAVHARVDGAGKLVGAGAAGTAATIVAALLAVAVGLAHTHSRHAIILRARAEAGRAQAATTAVAALFSLAIRYAEARAAETDILAAFAITALAATPIRSALLPGAFRQANANTLRALSLGTGAVAARSAAAVIPALHACAGRLARARTVDARFLDAATLSTRAFAPVRAAFEVLTSRLTHATALNAVVLEAGTRPALAAAAVVATLHTLAIRYAGAVTVDTLLLETVAVLDHAAVSAAVVVTARFAITLSKTHAVSVFTQVLGARAFSAKAAASVVSTLLVFARRKAARLLGGANLAGGATGRRTRCKRALALPLFRTGVAVVALAAGPATTVVAAILVQAVLGAFAGTFNANLSQFAFAALGAAPVVPALLTIAIRRADLQVFFDVEGVGAALETFARIPLIHLVGEVCRDVDLSGVYEDLGWVNIRSGVGISAMNGYLAVSTPDVRRGQFVRCAGAKVQRVVFGNRRIQAPGQHQKGKRCANSPESYLHTSNSAHGLSLPCFLGDISLT